MEYFSKNIFIEVTHWISDRLLDNPVMFNYIRYLLAGKQKGIRKFINTYLEKYNCKSIADFCCGTGDFAVCIPNNASYIGLDMNKDFINYSKNRFKNEKNKKFIKANVISSKYIYERKFDGILLISTLHHLSDNELLILLPRIKKITRKMVIIADIIPNPPHLLQKFFAKIDRGRYVRPKEEKLRILKKYFKIVKTQMIPTKTAVQFGIVCLPK
ncbi:MAG: hypothetical protein A3D75_01495 [Candidatus Levybacteria bacterium RIFCSPHIGHO2_02_FULL_37_18]|nr:MAG: hypothetical protein A3D75_01495 [Candidatus Levybacteria bacterium RIFCSPHIGHO2_02_FULL_37_18]OGH33467.1 MAG: hypothetical protein A3A47_04440 [Candidatus Levybacteria bacterium RIFCSPLOWO2_01_FULL_37_20]OGH44034.1 MAG: hypothetical protein A3J14_04785 [Candidatus Levybacteria bacterium RIFCSPLOWO2_02_FULL_37_18]